jgi:Holliday junction resolvase RusA-like endonuclease
VPRFEFVLEGPAISLRAKEKNPKRYQRWIRTVNGAAAGAWPPELQPATGRVEVEITNFYTAAPPDVDNIIKPILDGLRRVVYADDGQVYRVISTKTELAGSVPLRNPSPMLADAIVRWTEVLHVIVNW